MPCGRLEIWGLPTEEEMKDLVKQSREIYEAEEAENKARASKMPKLREFQSQGD